MSLSTGLEQQGPDRNDPCVYRPPVVPKEHHLRVRSPTIARSIAFAGVRHWLRNAGGSCSCSNFISNDISGPLPNELAELTSTRALCASLVDIRADLQHISHQQHSIFISVALTAFRVPLAIGRRSFGTEFCEPVARIESCAAGRMTTRTSAVPFHRLSRQ